MNVALIHPPFGSVYKKFKRKMIFRLPVGLAYLAATAEKHGHKCLILDAEPSGLTIRDIVKRTLAFNPQVVAISCTTPLFKTASNILAQIKKASPNIYTVLGGPHINALPKESLETSSAADFVIFGEGEDAFQELLHNLENDLSVKKIRGLAFRNNDNQVIINPARPFIENLDSLPFPARHLFDLDKYRDPDRYEESYTLITTSRGCPFRCIFCGSSITWGHKVRFRSPQNVLEEIDQVANQYKIKNITFCDDTFILNKQRVLEICRGIINQKLDIKFCCSSRVNTIDEELIENLAQAGCEEITFGIESADPKILKILNKDIDFDLVQPIFTLVKKHGIRVHSSYIIGAPTDSHETIQKTIQFAIDSGTDAAQFSICTPYPGTALWDMAIGQNKLLSKNFDDFGYYYNVVANLSEVSTEDLIHYQRESYRLFAESKQPTANRKT